MIHRDGTASTGKADWLFRAILTFAVGMALLHVFWFSTFGTQKVLTSVGWFVPVTLAFQSLACLSVSFLAIGRFLVLRDGTSYWTGIGFAIFGLDLALYVLTWPGLSPSGLAVIGTLPSTPAWIGMFASTALALSLLLGSWSNIDIFRAAGRSFRSVVLWVSIGLIWSFAVISVENHLPMLVTAEGVFTPLLRGWQWIVTVLFAAGAVIASKGYRRTCDTLIGYVAFAQIAMSFTQLTTVLGGRRFGALGFADRLIALCAFLFLLFGLLAEYVSLFRREREKTEDLAQAQAAAHLGNWRWDLRTNSVTWSDELYRIFGVDPATFVPSNEAANALIHPEDRMLHSELIGIALTGRSVEAFDCRIVRPGGEERVLLASGFNVRFDGSGKPRVLVGTLLDVTESRRAERELMTSEARYRELSEQLEIRVRQRTAELQALNKELEAFSYSVSHDLRAPLRTLDGFSQALQTSVDTLDDKGRHYLERIRAAAQRMRMLIDAFLQLSRMSRIEMQLRRVDLSEMAKAILQDLRISEPSREVEVRVDSGLHVNGDPQMLHAALHNLLANAWKFTMRKSQAVIEVGRARIKDEEAFFVRDNGAGFDMNAAEKLFAPFHRLHADAEFQGTGIGLATVQRIIGRHGGRIWAEASPGAGATFYFTISNAYQDRKSDSDQQRVERETQEANPVS